MDSNHLLTHANAVGDEAQRHAKGGRPKRRDTTSWSTAGSVSSMAESGQGAVRSPEAAAGASAYLKRFGTTPFFGGEGLPAAATAMPTRKPPRSRKQSRQRQGIASVGGGIAVSVGSTAVGPEMAILEGMTFMKPNN